MPPYRHFRDKDALLAVIAAEGFERLASKKPQTNCEVRVESYNR
jgi:AcrR family transcriptional regulator